MQRRTIHGWELLSTGGPYTLTYYDRDGAPFNGISEEFIKLHGYMVILHNVYTKTILVINEHGEIAARGKEN